jgi:hypothetical protein
VTEPPLTDAARLHRETIDAVKHELREAHALVAQIGQQLEILLLQVVRMDRGASDVVGTAHFTYETGETLKRLHTIVEARRRAADELIDSLMPARGHGAVQGTEGH